MLRVFSTVIHWLLSWFSISQYTLYVQNRVDSYYAGLTKGQQLSPCIHEHFTNIEFDVLATLLTQIRSHSLDDRFDGPILGVRKAARQNNSFRKLFDEFAIDINPQVGKGETLSSTLGRVVDLFLRLDKNTIRCLSGNPY